MDQVRAKCPELLHHPIPVAAEEWIAVKFLVDCEGETTFQFDGGNRIDPADSGFRAAMDAAKRQSPALCERRKLAAHGSHAVEFVETITEQSDSERFRHR